MSLCVQKWQNHALTVDGHTHKHTENIFPPIRLAKIKKLEKKPPNVGYVREHAALYNMNRCNQWVIGATLSENNLSVAFKLFTPQPLDSISFLGIYSTDTVTQMHENACMRMFIFTLFIIVERN